jgi:PadR family transcriptional regulator, regulatory protein PadR
MKKTGNGEDCCWSTFYIPTHRGEAAMDGAPDRTGRLEEGQATARAQADPSLRSRMTMLGRDDDLGRKGLNVLGWFRLAGSFDCGVHDEAVNTFAQDDGMLVRVNAFSSAFPLTFDRGKVILLLNVEGKMPATDLLQGTLDLLILRTLALEPMHGWGIAQRIQQVSKDALQIGQGSLYPALHRLEYKGWIQAEWGASENNRRAKFYSLTQTGQKQLKAELEDWGRISTAIALVLK